MGAIGCVNQYCVAYTLHSIFYRSHVSIFVMLVEWRFENLTFNYVKITCDAMWSGGIYVPVF